MDVLKLKGPEELLRLSVICHSHFYDKNNRNINKEDEIDFIMPANLNLLSAPLLHSKEREILAICLG